MINEKDIKNHKKYYKNDFLNFKNNKSSNYFSNIKFFSPKRNKYLSNNLENNSFGNTYKKYGNDSSKIYISCIDGKAIVNGMRKDIPFVSKFNYNNNNNSKLNNNNLFCNLYQTNNAGKSSRRNNSFNINKYLNKNEFTFEEKKNQIKFNNINSGTNDFNFDKLKNNFSKDNLTNKLNKMNDYYYTRKLKFFK